MANFKASLSRLLVLEGGWVNDPDDAGKETYCGISRKHDPDWEGWKIIDSYRSVSRFPGILSDDGKLATLVEQFYYKQWWSPLRLGYIQDDAIADEIFEMAINVGAVTAIRIVQQALNLLNKAGRVYEDTLVDGIIGNNTLATIDTFCGKSRPLIRTINGLQFEHYVEICRRNPSQEKFFYGWLSRT